MRAAGTIGPARRLTLWLGVVCAALPCLLVLNVSAAQAAVGYDEVGSLSPGGLGTGAGQFKGPAGVTVDNSCQIRGLTGAACTTADASNEDVYVVDSINARVEKFTAGGAFILAFGKEVDATTKANICTAASNDTCKAGVSGTAEGEFKADGYAFGFGGPTGVAVAPETGDVYVADSMNGRIEKFTSGGAYVCEITGGAASAGECDSAGSGLSTAFGTGIEGVVGVAVDPAVDTTNGGHDVYLANENGKAIYVFDSAGKYLREITEAEGAALGKPDGVAFDSAGDLYVLDRGSNAVYEFTNGAGAGVKLTMGRALSSEGAEAIAVSPFGEMLVDEHERAAAPYPPLHVLAFGPQPTGALLSEFGSGSGYFKIDVSGVAVNLANGNAYFSGGMEAGGFGGTSAANAVTFFERQEHSAPVATTGSATAVTPDEEQVSGRANPEGNPTTYTFEYGPCATPTTCATSAYPSKAPSPEASAGEGTTAQPVGPVTLAKLQPNKTYHYQLLAKNAYGTGEGGEATFTTGPEAPTIPAGAELASAITQTSATLEAQVNPNNEATESHFEYGTSPTLTGATSTATETLAASYGLKAVTAPVSELAPGTQYYFRLVASNTGGGVEDGAIEPLLTVPAEPETGAASSLSQTAATLTGSFDPNGVATTYYFEYGTTTAYYLGRTPTQESSSATPVQASAELSGLQPNTTYHYRLVVDNSASDGGGTAAGPDMQFATLPLLASVTTGPAQSVSQTAATLTGTIDAKGMAATYWLEYGPTADYGSTLLAGQLEGGGSAAAVTLALQGLAPGATYHYRLAAMTEDGTTYGGDMTFTTPGYPSVLAPPQLASFPDLSGFASIPPEKTTTGKKATPKTGHKRKSCRAKFEHVKNGVRRRREIEICSRHRHSDKRAGRHRRHHDRRRARMRRRRRG